MRDRVDVVIVGGGPAGMATAIWCQRLGLSHLLVEAEAELGGQLDRIENPVIDYPGLPTRNGRELKEKLVEHVRSIACVHRLQATVQSIDVAGRQLVLAQESDVVQFERLVLAMGSKARSLGVPGEQEMLARGEVWSATRDRERFAGQRVVVVGGGDRACEGALLLAAGGADVVLVHRSDRFRAREEYRLPLLRHPRVQVRTGAQVTAIYGTQGVEGVQVRYGGQGMESEHTSDVVFEDIAARAVFVRVGVEPNSQLVQGQLATDAEGFVQTDAIGRTSVPGVFAVGDVCTRPHFSSIASAVGQGMIIAKHLSLDAEKKGEVL